MIAIKQRQPTDLARRVIARIAVCHPDVSCPKSAVEIAVAAVKALEESGLLAYTDSDRHNNACLKDGRNAN